MAGFAHSKAIERRYAAQLAKVAKEVGKLAARFADYRAAQTARVEAKDAQISAQYSRL